MSVLRDIRIISLEQYGAGPFGTAQLADLGADVIRIETFEGDVARAVPPFAADGDSLFYESFNRNKRGIVLDINAPAGRAVFEDLIRRADVLYSSLRGDVVDKLGLRYADLAHLNQRLVCVSLSGYGLTGPRRAEPAYDYMIQAVTGWMSLTGEPDGIPTKSGLSVVDFSTGLAAAAAVVAGVHAARRDGVGCDCDLSLFDTAMSMLNYVGTWQATRGYAVERQSQSAHPTMTPFQAFRTADGWIVAGGTKEKFWRSMAHAVGRQDLLEDARFATVALRLSNRPALIGELASAFVRFGSAHWIRTLSEAGVPCGRVNSVAEALEDPQAEARGTIVATDHPNLGVVRSLANAVRVGPVKTDHSRAPMLGEHTVDVLRDVLGYSDARIDQLLADAVVGSGSFASGRESRLGPTA